MKNDLTFKLAASTLALGLTMVGCSPSASNFHPAAASASEAKADAKAAKAFAQAQAAVQQRDLKAALTFAEQAVEYSPRDVGYRTALGDLYLKNGRFLSAENAFTDVLTLHPVNQRAALSLALAQIAQGKSREAIQHLDNVVEELPVDAGLAYALAGQPQRAIEILEPAARAPGANARVRQNLALAYAVAGDWKKARGTASQDLSPTDLGRRMEEWADFANPTTAYLQVAALLGTTPVQDEGQPVRLALAPAAPEQPIYAEAPAPVQEAPVTVAEAPAPAQSETPVVVASAEPAQAFEYKAPEHGDPFAAPAAIEMVELPASSGAGPVTEVSGAQFAAAVTSLVEAPEPILKAVAPVAGLASVPVRPFTPQKAVKKGHGLGRYVVQIGAFRSAAQVEIAWSQAIRRYRFGNEPLSTTVSIPGRGTFHRLAVSGFETPAEAARACQAIRGKGGNCFVRPNAGDAPVRWASRYSGHNA